MKSTLNVICVDDEDVVLIALESQLGRLLGEDCVVEVAESGEEALELINELDAAGAEVALVISDQVMPGMKGDALLIAVHARYPKAMKILLTGQANTEAVGNAVNNANLYRYITKPWDKVDLGLTVKEALRRYKQDQRLAAQNALLQQRNQELATINEAYRAKSAFLSGMTHELRTPLNGVLGYVQILQADLRLEAGHYKILDTIESCGHHLLSLINEVLNLAKLESGQTVIDKAPTDLHRLLVESANVVRPNARAKGLQLEIDISPTLPKGLMTDGLKLRQVLFNLLGNAIKFTQEGAITLSARATAREVIVAVGDTGVGIDAEEIESLFLPFVQAEGGRTYGGTGLGLAISKNLSEMLGGRLELESVKGVGSTFRVTLPRNEADIEGRLPRASTRDKLRLPRGEQLEVLVVDDVATNRDVLGRLLSDAGMTVIEAATGQEALKLIRERRPPVVLMDLRMPDMDGQAACRAIRDDPEIADTRVIGVSASITTEILVGSGGTDFDDFVAKPIRREELLSKISEYAQITLATEAPPATLAVTPELTSEAVGALGRQLRDAAQIGDIAALESLVEGVAARGLLPDSLQRRLEGLCEELNFEALVLFAEELEGNLA